MKPFLIGLAGRMGSGKDTVGGMIREAMKVKGYPVKLVSFAEPLKSIVKMVYDFSWEQVNGTLEMKNTPDKRYPRPDGTFLTPREAMQKLGTEWGRACYPNTWADVGVRVAKGFCDAGLSVVITDCRFINEAKAIHDAGGQVWCIRRPEADVPATHQSELEMYTPGFQALINCSILNNGSLPLLRNRAELALGLLE
jgi:hypothetical protein